VRLRVGREQGRLVRARKPAATIPRYPKLPLDGYKAQPFFHQINTEFPGLQLIHEQPYIFLVHDFFSGDDCDVLRQAFNPSRSSDHIKRSALAQQQPSDAVYASQGIRTSSTLLMSHAEIAPLRSRMAELSLTQLQPTKLSRYDPGQLFEKHTDYNPPLRTFGAKTAEVAQAPLSFPNRFVSVWVYLNDVARGGCSNFSWLQERADLYADKLPQEAACFGIPVPPSSSDDGRARQGEILQEVSIVPEQGMAVVHFPCTKPEYGSIVDPNAAHEGAAAVDPKFICQQFIWSGPVDEHNTSYDERVRRYFAEEQTMRDPALQMPLASDV
jgi:hypothetical protein